MFSSKQQIHFWQSIDQRFHCLKSIQTLCTYCCSKSIQTLCIYCLKKFSGTKRDMLQRNKCPKKDTLARPSSRNCMKLSYHDQLSGRLGAIIPTNGTPWRILLNSVHIIVSSKQSNIVNQVAGQQIFLSS